MTRPWSGWCLQGQKVANEIDSLKGGFHQNGTPKLCPDIVQPESGALQAELFLIGFSSNYIQIRLKPRLEVVRLAKFEALDRQQFTAVFSLNMARIPQGAAEQS
jgi:hypothetical protein